MHHKLGSLPFAILTAGAFLGCNEMSYSDLGDEITEEEGAVETENGLSSINGLGPSARKRSH